MIMGDREAGMDTYRPEHVEDVNRGIVTAKYKCFPKQKSLRLLEMDQMVRIVLWLARS